METIPTLPSVSIVSVWRAAEEFSRSHPGTTVAWVAAKHKRTGTIRIPAQAIHGRPMLAHEIVAVQWRLGESAEAYFDDHREEIFWRRLIIWEGVKSAAARHNRRTLQQREFGGWGSWRHFLRSVRRVVAREYRTSKGSGHIAAIPSDVIHNVIYKEKPWLVGTRK